MVEVRAQGGLYFNLTRKEIQNNNNNNNNNSNNNGNDNDNFNYKLGNGLFIPAVPPYTNIR